jgi:hypothetical protein
LAVLATAATVAAGLADVAAAVVVAVVVVVEVVGTTEALRWPELPPRKASAKLQLPSGDRRGGW